MRRHLKVGREYRDQERDKAHTGEPSKLRDEHAETAEDLAGAAYLDEQRGCGKPRRNDPRVQCGVNEMIAAGSNKKDGE